MKLYKININCTYARHTFCQDQFCNCRDTVLALGQNVSKIFLAWTSTMYLCKTYILLRSVLSLQSNGPCTWPKCFKSVSGINCIYSFEGISMKLYTHDGQNQSVPVLLFVSVTSVIAELQTFDSAEAIPQMTRLFHINVIFITFCGCSSLSCFQKSMI